jgi:hypothetical protein
VYSTRINIVLTILPEKVDVNGDLSRAPASARQCWAHIECARIDNELTSLPEKVEEISGRRGWVGVVAGACNQLNLEFSWTAA